jgi:hypothetical protein
VALLGRTYGIQRSRGGLSDTVTSSAIPVTEVTMLLRRPGARTLLLLATVLTGLLVPANPARAANYANCTQPIDSTYYWLQSSCLWNEGGLLYGNSGVIFISGFNRANVTSCSLRLEIWQDVVLYPPVGTHSYNCLTEARRGGQFVPPRKYWFKNNGSVFRQYAYLVVGTNTRDYDSRETVCAVKYYPLPDGGPGC